MLGTSWHAYPTVYALGHRALAELLLDPVVVEEKVDGSQFSFGRFGGELWCRSKGARLNVFAPDHMFRRAVEVAGSLDLHDGWTYRAEYLAKPKHNTLAYLRVPRNHLLLFDVNTAHEAYLAPADRQAHAESLDLECAPVLHEGLVDPVDGVVFFHNLLATTSCLGGQTVEGIVVKNYVRFGPDKKALMGKYVSERFKETHAREWKVTNPAQKDILLRLVETYRAPARWAKAVQHLREAGKLEQAPRDIGLLVKEVPADIERECKEEILEALWQWAWPHVQRGAVRGVAEWYKATLLEGQFSNEEPGKEVTP